MKIKRTSKTVAAVPILAVLMPLATQAALPPPDSVWIHAPVDVSADGKCNCSLCRKIRNWSVSVKPEAFRLLGDSASATTDDARNGMVHWPFCSTCDVRPYAQGEIPEMGGKFVSVQLACLDDVDDAVLAALPVRYLDGKDDDWQHEPSTDERAFL